MRLIMALTCFATPVLRALSFLVVVPASCQSRDLAVPELRDNGTAPGDTLPLILPREAAGYCGSA